MPNKINKSTYELSSNQLDELKKKISDPNYIDKAISWIAEYLAANMGDLQ